MTFGQSTLMCWLPCKYSRKRDLMIDIFWHAECCVAQLSSTKNNKRSELSVKQVGIIYMSSHQRVAAGILSIH